MVRRIISLPFLSSRTFTFSSAFLGMSNPAFAPQLASGSNRIRAPFDPPDPSTLEYVPVWRGRINGKLIVWVSVYKSTEKVQACLLTIAIGRLAQQPATINHGNDNTYLHSAKPTNQWINSYGKIRDREFCLRILFVWQNNFRVWARNQSKSVNNSP